MTLNQATTELVKRRRYSNKRRLSKETNTENGTAVSPGDVPHDRRVGMPSVFIWADFRAFLTAATYHIVALQPLKDPTAGRWDSDFPSRKGSMRVEGGHVAYRLNCKGWTGAMAKARCRSC